MSGAPIQRNELGKFLSETGSWRILVIGASPRMGRVFDITMVNSNTRQCFWRIHAFGTADFALRPPNPATVMGGPEILWSKDDPRLAAPGLQYIPGGDGDTYNPPRQYQLLELDQSWIIAERFEIEPLPQTRVG